MNKNKLNSMVHRVSEETGIVYNSVLAYYFMEDVLTKISESNYKENYIFKGGFLLSNIVGISSRATVDIDFQIRNEDLSEANIEEMLLEILEVKESPIDYTIASIKPIKEGDFYGGFRIMLLARLDNIKQYVPLDIATGDVITPRPITYEYESIFDKKQIPVIAYPIETMIAEKLETIYSKGFLNSRSKDYFDLYLIWTLLGKEIDKTLMREAIANTFSQRNTTYDPNQIKNLLNQMNTPVFIGRWDAYRRKNNFVGNLSFKEVLESVLELMSFLE